MPHAGTADFGIVRCQVNSVYVQANISLTLTRTNIQSLTAWEEASEKAREFVAQLSLDEKIGIASGGYSKPQLQCVGSVGPIERLGFGGMCFSDGPAGYSRSDSVSVFPSGITVAASWDRRLMYERAVAIGDEFRDKGAHVHLGYVFPIVSRRVLPKPSLLTFRA